MAAYSTQHSDYRISLWTGRIDSGQCDDRPLDDISPVSNLRSLVMEGPVHKKMDPAQEIIKFTGYVV